MQVAILVGGYGRRLGLEKAEAELCGKKLIEIIVEKFKDLESFIVCRDLEQAKKFSKYGNTIVDEIKNFGPLSGIHAALKNLGDCLIVAVDMPFVKREVVEKMWRIGKNYKTLIPYTNRPEPLLAFYSSKILEKIEDAMKRGVRKILDALGEDANFYDAKELDPDLTSFFNINTVEDLRVAERIFRCLDASRSLR